MTKISADAGGDWICSVSAPAYPQDQRDYDDRDGWAVYPFKRHARTRREIRKAANLPKGASVTLWSCTDDLRAEEKQIYEEARQATREACQRPAVIEAPHQPRRPPAPRRLLRRRSCRLAMALLRWRGRRSPCRSL